MAQVDYRNIAKSYGSMKVMEDISFTIPDGKFVVLLGPSGCGKTTLLRMTAGLEKITRGEVMIGGEKMNGVHPRDRDIAMVFQSYALYPQMSVADNIAFGLQVRGMKKADVAERVKWAAGILALEPYLDRKPAALSGGQRQRVAMGRAIVREPKVFLFDEPLSNLDAKLRGQMRYEIRQLHDRVNATTIYVTHDQVEAMTMADLIVVMRGGEIMQMGTPDEVYDRPANLFVADFIGSPAINLLAGESTADGVRFGKAVLPLPGRIEPGEASSTASGRWTSGSASRARREASPPRCFCRKPPARRRSSMSRSRIRRCGSSFPSAAASRGTPPSASRSTAPRRWSSTPAPRRASSRRRELRHEPDRHSRRRRHGLGPRGARPRQRP